MSTAMMLSAQLAEMAVPTGLHLWPLRREIQLTGDLSLKLKHPEALSEVLRAARAAMPRAVIEQLWMACFNMQGDLLGTYLIGEGSSLAVAITTRRVAQASLNCNASAILLLHNHLAPDSTPSRSDLEATQQLREYLDPLEITLLDHIVVAEDGRMTAILGKIDLSGLQPGRERQSNGEENLAVADTVAGEDDSHGI